MILIGDAGGTSTHWRIIDDSQRIHQFETRGLNLMHHQSGDYLKACSEKLLPYKTVDHLYFYAAGYFEHTEKAKELRSELAGFFETSTIEVNNDLLAAARSLCGHQSGWVGILGTGANVAYFDGRSIKDQVAPLGYLLGDEGSGADLGKNFVKLFFRGQLASSLKDDFLNSYATSKDELLASIYDKSDPKLFLSSFSNFFLKHKSDPDIYRMIYQVFDHHLEVFLQHKKDDLPLHYTGSVAYHFGDILRRAAVDRGIAIGQITKDPIAGLALYHQKSVL